MRDLINWKDRQVEFPDRVKLTDLGGGFFKIEKAPGTIEEAGTPQNKDNFNNMDVGTFEALMIAEEDAERLPEEKKSELWRITADLNRELDGSRDAADAMVAMDRAEQRLEQLRQQTAGEASAGAGAAGENAAGNDGKGDGTQAAAEDDRRHDDDQHRDDHKFDQALFHSVRPPCF